MIRTGAKIISIRLWESIRRETERERREIHLTLFNTPPVSPPNLGGDILFIETSVINL